MIQNMIGKGYDDRYYPTATAFAPVPQFLEGPFPFLPRILTPPRPLASPFSGTVQVRRSCGIFCMPDVVECRCGGAIRGASASPPVSVVFCTRAFYEKNWQKYAT
jgi:hypothetical protein